MTSPPATPPGRPTFAKRPYSRRIARTRDAMKLPTSPPATPFGACFRIASMSASVLPNAAIHTFPNTGREYQIPPMMKLTMAATMTAMSEFVSKRATASSPGRRTAGTDLWFSQNPHVQGARTNTYPSRGPAILGQSGGVGHRSRCGRRSRGGSRGDRLGRRFRFWRVEEIPDHGRVRIDEAAGEASLAQPEDVRFLEASAHVHVEADPLARPEERGVRPEFGSEAPEVHHADRREANAAQRLRDIQEVDVGFAWLPPDHFSIPVEARKHFGRQRIEGGKGVERAEGLRACDHPFHVEHVAVHDLLRLAASGVEPHVAPLSQVPRDVEVRVRAVDAREVEHVDAGRIVPRSPDRIPIFLERDPVSGRRQRARVPPNPGDRRDTYRQEIQELDVDQRICLDRENRDRHGTFLRGRGFRLPDAFLLPLELGARRLRVEEDREAHVATCVAHVRAAVAVDARDRAHHEQIRMDLTAPAPPARREIRRPETPRHRTRLTRRE